nr:hypothetical protein [Planctomycetota bacterium]
MLTTPLTRLAALLLGSGLLLTPLHAEDALPDDQAPIAPAPAADGLLSILPWLDTSAPFQLTADLTALRAGALATKPFSALSDAQLAPMVSLIETAMAGSKRGTATIDGLRNIQALTLSMYNRDRTITAVELGAAAEAIRALLPAAEDGASIGSFTVGGSMRDGRAHAWDGSRMLIGPEAELRAHADRRAQEQINIRVPDAAIDTNLDLTTTVARYAELIPADVPQLNALVSAFLGPDWRQATPKIHTSIDVDADGWVATASMTEAIAYDPID